MDITMMAWIGTAVVAFVMGLLLVRGSKQRQQVAPIPVRVERTTPQQRN
jgi:hypothetical protein